MKNRMLVMLFIVSAFTSAAYAGVGVATQKLNSANTLLTKLVSPKGYKIVAQSLRLSTSWNVLQFSAIIGPENDIEVCDFQAEKDGARYKGWIYLVSYKSNKVAAEMKEALAKDESKLVSVDVDPNDQVGVFYILAKISAVGNPEVPSFQDLHLKLN